MNQSQRHNNKFLHFTKLMKNNSKDDKIIITNYLTKNPKSCNVTPIPNKVKNTKSFYSKETVSELKLQNKKLTEKVKELKSKLLELNHKLNQYNNITYRNRTNLKNSSNEVINITENSQSLISKDTNHIKTKKRISFNFTAYPTTDNSNNRISRSYTNFSFGNNENQEFELLIQDLEKRINQTNQVIPTLIQKYKKYKEYYENIKKENIKLKKENEDFKITLQNIRKELIIFEQHSVNNLNEQQKKLCYLNNYILSQKKDFDDEKKKLIHSLTSLAEENKIISERLIQLSERDKKIDFSDFTNNPTINNENFISLGNEGIINLKKKLNIQQKKY